MSSPSVPVHRRAPQTGAMSPTQVQNVTRVGIVAGSAVSVYRHTRNAQRPVSLAIGVCIPAAGYLLTRYTTRGLAQLSRPVTPAMAPDWHTSTHLPLHLGMEGTRNPNALVGRTPRGPVMIVSEAFMGLNTEDQRNLYNKALGAHARVASPLWVSLSTVSSVSTVVLERVWVGNKETLSLPSAVGLAATTLARAYLATKIGNRLMDRYGPDYQAA